MRLASAHAGNNKAINVLAPNPVIWTPDENHIAQTAMFRYMQEMGFADYAALHRWSVENSDQFWQAIAKLGDVRFDREPECVVAQPGDITTAKFFVGSRLSFPAHVLRHAGEHPAIVFRGENQSRRELSFNELRAASAAFAHRLRDIGVGPGDRVAGFLPNCPEAIIAMLGATSIGAIWSSCSPDFGINGVVDRFGQIKPTVLVCADGYFYNGKRHDSMAAVAGVLQRISGIREVVLVPFAGDASGAGDIGATLWEDFLPDSSTPEFQPQPFDHPLYIMYSSGTTGVPKCIVHGAGGTLVQHLKEHILHCDIRPGDRLFFFTTCGWMMWNWLVSALTVGATIYLYDGSPFAEDGRALWRMADEEKLTGFGSGAKFISATEKAGVLPGKEFDLSSVRSIFSTGSVLAPESFDFVYASISNDVQLASISGGTDILSCFAGGNPAAPVRRGELQCLALGMDVQIFDDDGKSLVGKTGELVCTNAFPSMPIGFWNDEDGARYHDAYFDKYPGVWAHGDYAEITTEGSMIIYGRSDAVLNPGGVRIGTAEIYRQVEKLNDVVECLAIGQEWEDDVRIVLFVVMRDGVALDDDKQAQIRAAIRNETTPRHVPSVIVPVPDIPRTISGKIVELAVRNIVHGRPVKNTDALANPESLEYFRNRPELAESV